MSELRGPWKSPAFPAFTGRETEQGWDQGHIRMKTCAAVRHWLVFVLLCFFYQIVKVHFTLKIAVIFRKYT